MIVRLARHGGRDAIFDVPAQVLRTAPTDRAVDVHLADDSSVTATGRVREVSPQADPVTRTFQVKVDRPLFRLDIGVGRHVARNDLRVLEPSAGNVRRGRWVDLHKTHQQARPWRPPSGRRRFAVFSLRSVEPSVPAWCQNATTTPEQEIIHQSNLAPVLAGWVD